MPCKNGHSDNWYYHPKTGRRACKDCRNESARRWNEEHREDSNARRRVAWASNPQIKQSNKEYRAKNRDKYRELDRDRYWNRGRKEKDRAYKFKVKYGLSVEQYDNIINNQKGLCPICKNTLPTTIKNIHIDHDHENGKIRGILCNNCNVGLGKLKDSMTILRNAVKYLELPK